MRDGLHAYAFLVAYGILVLLCVYGLVWLFSIAAATP